MEEYGSTSRCQIESLRTNWNVTSTQGWMVGECGGIDAAGDVKIVSMCAEGVNVLKPDETTSNH